MSIEIRLLEQHHHIIRIAKRKSRFKKGWKTCLGQESKKRIAWDHHKATVELIKEQRLYILLCDLYVSTEELEGFLYSQHIAIGS